MLPLINQIPSTLSTLLWRLETVFIYIWGCKEYDEKAMEWEMWPSQQKMCIAPYRLIMVGNKYQFDFSASERAINTSLYVKFNKRT